MQSPLRSQSQIVDEVESNAVEEIAAEPRRQTPDEAPENSAEPEPTGY